MGNRGQKINLFNSEIGEFKDFFEDKTIEPSQHKLTISTIKIKNKTVTIIEKFYVSTKELKNLLQTLKKSLSTGGTIKGESIHIQGNFNDKAKLYLVKLGFTFK